MQTNHIEVPNTQLHVPIMLQMETLYNYVVILENKRHLYGHAPTQHTKGHASKGKFYTSVRVQSIRTTWCIALLQMQIQPLV